MRHALLAAAFGVLLVLPIASIVALPAPNARPTHHRSEPTSRNPDRIDAPGRFEPFRAACYKRDCHLQ